MKTFLLSLILAAVATAQSPIRVLLVTGGHDHDLEFYSIFADPRFRVTVDGHPSAYRRPFENRYDVLVTYDTTEDPDEKKRANLKAFAEAGRGIVVLHHGICSFVKWPYWTEQVVGGRYRFEADDTGPASSYSHDESIEVEVAATHPVTEGVSAFTIHDETYKNLWIAPTVKPLLTTSHPKGDRTIAWIGPHPKSRVIYLQFGHDRQAHTNPSYQRLVRNAIAWSAAR
jgi:type 1 glutamine amidotransferase